MNAEAPDLQQSAGVLLLLVNEPDTGPRMIASFLTNEEFAEMGVIPAAGTIGAMRELGGGLTPENFDVNKEFVSFYHETMILSAPLNLSLQDAARRQGGGKIHVVDGRTAVPGSSTPSEDIVGSFPVDAGRLVYMDYQPNPNWRVFTASGWLHIGHRVREMMVLRLMLSERSRRPR